MNSIPVWFRICFGTRINRQRFFLYQLAFSICFLLLVISLILTLAAPIAAFHIASASYITKSFFLCFLVVLVLIIVYALAFDFSLTVRRLHDLDKSWTWIFLCFIPIIGWLFLLYLLFAKGTIGTNKYGTDPLEYHSYEEYLESESIIE